MSNELTRTEFYQDDDGRIFAIVGIQREGNREGYRFIPGIERLPYTAEALFDEAKIGFPGHSQIDLLYNGKAVYDYLNLNPEDGYTYIYDMINSPFIRCIAVIWSDLAASFYFENMDKRSSELFNEILAMAQAEQFDFF